MEKFKVKILSEMVTQECNSCHKILKSDFLRSFCPRCYSASLTLLSNNQTKK